MLRIIFLVVFFLNVVCPIRSQINDKTYPLAEILTGLQNEFPYIFSYADDIIEGIQIKPIPKNLSFQETLSFLRNETGLIFTKIDNRFVVVNKTTSTSFITGLVLEKYTQKPIYGATVKKGENAITNTNIKGRFQLKVSDTFTLAEYITIEHIGYESNQKSSTFFKQKDSAIVFLTPKIENLHEVVVKNYITKGINKTQDGSFKISYSDFDILPGLIESDVLQTIQALPGIQSTDETVSNINVRGGTHDQNLILWDGIKMYQSGHFFGLISVFNPSMTKEALLIKNGTSAEYGDGTSGTIIMNTDSEINTKFIGKIGANMINVNGFIDTPIGKKSSLQIGSRKAISDFVKTPTYSRYFKRISQDSEIGKNNETDIAFDFYDINARWNYNISEKDQLRLNFISIQNELVFTENATINAQELSKQSSLIQNSIAGGIWYQRNWNNRFTTALQAYETDYKLKAINVNLQDDQRFLQENVVSETGVKLNSFFKFSDQAKWLNGYQFIETGITNLSDIDFPVFRQNEISVIRTHSFFSEIDWKIKKLNAIKLGMKYTYNNKFNSHIIEPRLSYNHKFSNHFNAEVLGEFKHQNTSQIINFQNDFLGIEKRRWFLANEENIPVIKSKQASLGIHYHKNSLLISTETYVKKVEGITAKSQGFLNQYENVQAIGNYNVWGLDFLVNKRFNKLNAWIRYSWIQNDYIFDSFEEVEFPNNFETVNSLALGTSYTFKDLKIAAGLNWHSGLPTTTPVFLNPIENDNINYQPANSSRLNQYTRLDFSATYSFDLSKRVKAQTAFSIWNVLDYENIISSYYRLNNENTIQEFNNSALEITPNFNFNVSF